MARRSLLLHLVCSLVPADVESTRLEWERAYRDLDELMADPASAPHLQAQVDTITKELRRRIGGTFTLRELVDTYAGADSWARAVLSEQGAPGWPRTLTLVAGAAFDVYARGAVDFTP